jgi:hypothetical protein
MKTILSAILGSLILVCLNASAVNEAIPSYTTSPTVGFSTNGAGFEFVVGANPIEVNALGFNGSDLLSSPYLVSLYSMTGTTLASATVTTGSSFINQTYYTSIAPIILPAYSTNFIGAGEVSGGEWLGNVASSFTPNSQIFYESAVEDFVHGIPQAYEGQNSFLIDENFTFTAVPEPSVACLGVAGGLLILAVRWNWLRKPAHVTMPRRS